MRVFIVKANTLFITAIYNLFVKDWKEKKERKKGSGLEMTHFPLILACC